MFGFFSKKKAATKVEAPVVLCSSERAYAAAWNKTTAEWLAMTPEEQRDARDRVSFAPNVAGLSK
jgi:hypothetical protein